MIAETSDAKGFVRDCEYYHKWMEELCIEAVRTLQAADADGNPKRWWRGNVRYETFGHKPELRVGGVFQLRSEPYPAGHEIGRYRIVAMARAPEGYTAIVTYEDDWLPANGSPIPMITLGMLVDGWRAPLQPDDGLAGDDGMIGG